MMTMTNVTAATSGPILRVDGLSVRYGKVEALHRARIEVRPGQIVSVIGPNGAGKSTLLNAIMGSLPVTGFSNGGWNVPRPGKA
jgi:branched-chain amino acid transport system ATP-binding protein